MSTLFESMESMESLSCNYVTIILCVIIKLIQIKPSILSQAVTTVPKSATISIYKIKFKDNKIKMQDIIFIIEYIEICFVNSVLFYLSIKRIQSNKYMYIHVSTMYIRSSAVVIKFSRFEYILSLGCIYRIQSIRIFVYLIIRCIYQNNCIRIYFIFIKLIAFEYISSLSN